MFFKKKEKISEDKIQVNTSTITTFIGIDSVFEGKLSTKASLRIDGVVVGDIRCDGIVILTKSGKVTGTIEAESIIVAGTIEGNMSIRDKVNVEPSGKIYGEIITKKFVISEEAIFQGNCIMNRDGEVIPVTPYGENKDDDKKVDEGTKNSNKPSEAGEDKKDSNNQSAKSKKAQRAEKRKKANANKSVKPDDNKESGGTEKPEADVKNNKSEKQASEKVEKAESKDKESVDKASDNKKDDVKKTKEDIKENTKDSVEDKKVDKAEKNVKEKVDEVKSDDSDEGDTEIRIGSIDEIDTLETETLKSVDDGYIDSNQVPNPKNGNLVKKTKSLSVEIDNQ